MNQQELKKLIENAFKGVTLDGGFSILQTQVMDNWGEGHTEESFNKLPLQDNTTNWERLSLEDLDNLVVPFLDANGFRYYIPALMTSLLSDYDHVSLRIIATISSLRPSTTDHDMRKYTLDRYTTLTDKQLETIAIFVYWLPKVLNLEFSEDSKLLQRAYDDYWHQYYKPN